MTTSKKKSSNRRYNKTIKITSKKEPELTHLELFTKVYETRKWGDNDDPAYEGSSGTGSDINYNMKTYVPLVRDFITKYNIRSVVDLGCGDFRVGLFIYNGMNVNYTGYDAYKKVVDSNNETYNPYGKFNFIHSDFASKGDRIHLKPADLCIIKDVVQHWPYADIINFLDYIIKSKKYKYILLTNCYLGKIDGAYNGDDIKEAGGFHPLSIKKYPLNKYNGEILYTWDTKEVSLIIPKVKLSRTSHSIITNTHKPNKTYIRKQIYLMNTEGIGNKIFDLIFGIYLFNLYNKIHNKTDTFELHCDINYVLVKSPYDMKNDPTIDRIFPKCKGKIKFISERQYENINLDPQTQIYKIYNNDPSLKTLDSIPKINELKEHTKIDNNFALVYKMYENFDMEDKSIFTSQNINKSLISISHLANHATHINQGYLTQKKINTSHLRVSYDIKNKKPFTIIHIRYGDKLQFLKKYINKDDMTAADITKLHESDVDKFLLYTPQYYIDRINFLLKQNPEQTIYIISDSDDLVKEFIIKDSSYGKRDLGLKGNKRVVLLENLSWLNTFYLLYFASHIILSCSLYSFAGAYFNENNAECELVIYHNNNKKETIAPEELAISPKWIINNSIYYKRYILNYNPDIAFKILKYKYHWRY